MDTITEEEITEQTLELSRVEQLVNASYDLYTSANPVDRERLKSFVEEHILKHEKGLSTIGYGYDEEMIKAARIFLDKINAGELK